MSVTFKFGNSSLPEAELNLLEYVTDEVENELAGFLDTGRSIPVTIEFGNFPDAGITGVGYTPLVNRIPGQTFISIAGIQINPELVGTLAVNSYSYTLIPEYIETTVAKEFGRIIDNIDPGVGDGYYASSVNPNKNVYGYATGSTRGTITPLQTADNNEGNFIEDITRIILRLPQRVINTAYVQPANLPEDVRDFHDPEYGNPAVAPHPIFAPNNGYYVPVLVSDIAARFVNFIWRLLSSVTVSVSSTSLKSIVMGSPSLASTSPSLSLVKMIDLLLGFSTSVICPSSDILYA